MQQFKNADLQGGFDIVVEDGSMTPKTTLGMRASVEHLNSLGFIDPNDPDQKHKVYQMFGMTKLSPSLDVHMQAALRKQQAFEEWARNPEAQQQSVMLAEQDMAQYQAEIAAIPPPPPVQQPEPTVGPDGQPGVAAAPAPEPLPNIPPPPSLNKRTPLAWKAWYNPAIHKQEFLKWANSDVMVQMLEENPALEALLEAHLQEMDTALAAQMMMQQAPPKPGGGGIGAGQAMKNSNSESGGSQNADNNQAKTS
jgi:hypothetical protein